jgi:hypothetical protein
MKKTKREKEKILHIPSNGIKLGDKNPQLAHFSVE